MNDFINKAIDRLCLFLFLILISFPIFQILSRYVDFFSIPASQEIVQHMTLWIGFVGAVIAARSNKLLSVVREPVFRSSDSNELTHFFVHAFSVTVVFILSISYLKMIQIGIQYPEYIAPYITTWFAQSIIPIGLILIWYQMIITSSQDLKYRLILVIVSIITTITLYFWQFPLENSFLLWPKVAFALVLVAFGLPIFVLLASLSIFFFFHIQ